MKTTLLMAGIAAGFTLIAADASAQERPDFATLDANGDGMLSLEEMQAAGDAHFASADTDGDGLLSEAELTAAASERAADRVARMLERLDTNEDGGLSQAEIEVVRRGGGEISERMFNRIDADENGSISEEEFEEVRERMGERRGGGKNRQGGGGRDRG